MIGGNTRVFTLLGDPVGHSLSPVMHNAAFRALGLDAVYVALRTVAPDVPDLIRALARAGGGGNVTVPHKEIAAKSVERASGSVQTLGACNTFWGENGHSRGDNTDMVGVAEALDRLEAPPTAWLVAGTGGGARAVVAVAAVRGAQVAIKSRDQLRRRKFEEWVKGQGVAQAVATDCEVLINTTPLGLQAGDHLPLALDDAPQARMALDLVYHRGETAWVRQMRQEGLRAADGRVMLVGQGAAAFRCWFPDEEPPAEVMAAAVNDALR